MKYSKVGRRKGGGGVRRAWREGGREGGWVIRVWREKEQERDEIERKGSFIAVV